MNPQAPSPLSDEDLLSNCLDLAFYQYSNEEIEDENDGYDDFMDSFGQLYGAAKERYHGKQNKDSFYNKKNRKNQTLFGKLYDSCLNSFVTDDILEFMAERYDCLDKIKPAIKTFCDEYPEYTPTELVDYILNDLVQHRVRPIDKEILSILKSELGDPFYFIVDGLRYALLPLIEAANDIPTRYGNKFGNILMNVFQDTIVTIVDGMRLLFKTDLKGVEKYIQYFMKSHQKMSGKNAQFNDMMGIFGAQYVLEKYCKTRNIHYQPDSQGMEEFLQSMGPVMNAMGTMQNIVREFPRNEEEDDSVVLEQCFKQSVEKDYFYDVQINGNNTSLWESLPLDDLLNHFNIKFVPHDPNTQDVNVDSMQYNVNDEVQIFDEENDNINSDSQNDMDTTKQPPNDDINYI
ncbi:Cullin N-terminal domain-containing protein [Entamoeba marina]